MATSDIPEAGEEGVATGAGGGWVQALFPLLEKAVDE
jgi:hypothetical protein